jgi:hypothetical protein
VIDLTCIRYFELKVINGEETLNARRIFVGLV